MHSTALRRIVLSFALLLGARAFASDPLPAYGADITGVTVSGVSSGGYMAVQVHVAHSSFVKGVGVIAAGPYYCAQDNAWTAYYNCRAPGTLTPMPAVEVLKANTDVFARGKLIDPTEHLTAARVWLFSGTNDRTVDSVVVDALRRYYLLHNVPAASIVFVRDKPAGHAMVTENVGAPCDTSQSPFIVDCGYDAAGELLAHLLGPLERPAAKESGRILRFDQKAFNGGDAYTIGMADSGYVYVPRVCETERCRVHVALHGCRQHVQAVGEQFVREAGYNRWADANRIIVVYPQTIPRSGWGWHGAGFSFVYNPRGCWDWWGYTGPQYHTKAAPQIRALKGMIDRLGEARK